MGEETSQEWWDSLNSWVGLADLGVVDLEDWEGFLEESCLEVLPIRVVSLGMTRTVYTSKEYLVEAQRLFRHMIH